VKMADRITNLSEPPPAWPDEKRRAYLDEARTIAQTLQGASAALDARMAQRIADYARYL